MSTVTKEFEEVELPNGKIVNLTITVTAFLEANYGADADGNRGVAKWLIDSHTHEVSSDEDLDVEDREQVSEKVEEMVYEEEWDFENADDADDEDEGMF